MLQYYKFMRELSMRLPFTSLTFLSVSLTLSAFIKMAAAQKGTPHPAEEVPRYGM